MASEDTLLGNDLVFQIGSTDSPPVFTDLCAAFDTGGIGEEKPIVDVTTLCDVARTYRNGLPDGVEIPLQVNYIPGDEGIKALYDAYKADEVRSFRLARKDEPEEYFQFNAIVRAWNVATPVGERAALTFTLKISGEVLWATPAP